MGYIYKTTNTLNGKIYIGKKHFDVFDESYYGSGMLLKNSIAKHNGTNHLKCEVLEWCNNDDIDRRERVWIRYHKIKGYHLYNIAEGGTGGNTMKYKTKEEKSAVYQKVVAAKKANGTNIDSDDTKYRKSQSAKKRIIDKPWTLPDNSGRQYSEHAISNIRESAKKRRGERTITNGIVEKKIGPTEKIPEGFYLGRSDKMVRMLRSRKSTPETNRKKSLANTGNKCYTDGVSNKWVKPGDQPPAGWQLGMTRRIK